MSQESASSCHSLPCETVLDQDEDFIQGLLEVEHLYFPTNIDIENGGESDEDAEGHDESDDYSDSDEECYVPLNPSDADTREYISQAKFKNDTCGCNEFYGVPCSTKIDFDKALEFREYCQELNREELDLVIKAELYYHRKSGEFTESTKHKTKSRERTFQAFYFNGQRVCRQTYCFLHNIGKNKLNSITKSLDKDGLVPRSHGNVGKTPSHSLTFTDRERIKTFLSKYVLNHALPLPGRLPNFKSEKVLLLPSDTTAMDVFNKYDELAKEMQFRQVSLRTFQKIWYDLFPYICIMKPYTDLCHLCQKYSKQLTISGRLTEEEKSEIIKQYTTHVNLAKQQRDFYREQCLSSKENFKSLPDELKQANPPCTVEETFHYSWDYAQQVHYPHQPQQVGPVFFKTTRNCNVFGMCSDGTGRQVFYLVDEGESTGKGCNSVIGMVHHYFSHHGIGEKHAQIHADNCTGQNKNNIVLWYLLWRTLVGLHQSIVYSMVIAGHTKFDPDWHFGLWKMKWRCSQAETMDEIAHTVTSSSRSGHNIAQLINDKDKPVIFYNWRDYLKQFFKPLKKISTYHHFYIDISEPGIVTCKEHTSPEPVKCNLLRKQNALPKLEDITNGDLKNIEAPGLGNERQWYLYEEIREFCYSEESKDKVCPKPLVPKKEKICKVDDDKSPDQACMSSRKQLLLC